MKRLPISVSLALAATLTLAGCGTNDKASTSGGASSSSSNRDSASADSGASSRTFNSADVTFAQSMIPHHRQAVEMAMMAKKAAASTEVKKLADKIEAAQGPEIKTMTGWLEDWGKKVPSSAGSGMHHDMGSMESNDMPGMMSSQQMKDLGATTGAEFDRMWLTMMIKHHTGAIEMATAEQTNGKDTDAVALARKIQADQTAEIAQMKTLLKS